MLKIDALELIQIIANNEGYNDIYKLIKYARGVIDYRDVTGIATDNGFELKTKKATTSRKVYSKLKHYKGIPCGTSGVFEMETTPDILEVTCSKCVRLIYQGISESRTKLKSRP